MVAAPLAVYHLYQIRQNTISTKLPKSLQVTAEGVPVWRSIVRTRYRVLSRAKTRAVSIEICRSMEKIEAVPARSLWNAQARERKYPCYSSGALPDVSAGARQSKSLRIVATSGSSGWLKCSRVRRKARTTRAVGKDNRSVPAQTTRPFPLQLGEGWGEKGLRIPGANG